MLQWSATWLWEQATLVPYPSHYLPWSLWVKHFLQSTNVHSRIQRIPTVISSTIFMLKIGWDVLIFLPESAAIPMLVLHKSTWLCSRHSRETDFTVKYLKMRHLLYNYVKTTQACTMYVSQTAKFHNFPNYHSKVSKTVQMCENNELRNYFRLKKGW